MNGLFKSRSKCMRDGWIRRNCNKFGLILIKNVLFCLNGLFKSRSKCKQGAWMVESRITLREPSLFESSMETED